MCYAESCRTRSLTIIWQFFGYYMLQISAEKMCWLCMQNIKEMAAVVVVVVVAAAVAAAYIAAQQ